MAANQQTISEGTIVLVEIGQTIDSKISKRGDQFPLRLSEPLLIGERVVLPTVGIFADGVAVAQIGQHTFEICKDYVDEVITVSTDEICAAIKDIYDDTRSITEPAGALSVAGIKKYVEREGVQGKVLVGISKRCAEGVTTHNLNTPDAFAAARAALV